MDERRQLEHLRQRLASRLGQERFELWFHRSTRLSLRHGKLLVETPNRFYHEWLRRNFRGDLEAVCDEVLGRVLAVEFVLNPQLSETTQQVDPSDAGLSSGLPVEPVAPRREPVLRLGQAESSTVPAPKAATPSKPRGKSAPQPTLFASFETEAVEPPSIETALHAEPAALLVEPVLKSTKSKAGKSAEAKASELKAAELKATEFKAAAVVEHSAKSAGGPPARRFAGLDSFVVGESNRLAAASVKMVVDRVGCLTPLFLYGPTGVGKTHLLEGVWSAVRKAHPTWRVAFRSAEQFTTDFVAAVHGGQGLPSFRHKYRGLSLLVIDDVQFFRGKKATLVELLHTVDALTTAGRQVVLAADRSPAELAELGGEMTTRLAAGMVCRVDPPDFETRRGVLRQLSRRQGLLLPENVEAWIAGQLTSHAWELAGAVNRLQATSLAVGKPVCLSLAEDALGELVRESRKAVRLPDIERAVCAAFGLDPSALQSNRRTKQVTHPRMLAMWLARKYTRSALSEIGQFFGRKSHSTVISAQKKVDSWVAGRACLEFTDRRLSIDEAMRIVEKNLAVG